MEALRINQLRKIYTNGFEAVKGIDLTVTQGDFFALLGANGAGKSTTIGLITTLLKKTSGNIHLFGYDLDQETAQAKSCIGLVPQDFNLNLFETCEQILINQAGFYGISIKKVKNYADELLLQLGLWEKRQTMVRQLSGGMKRRLMIARALIHKPRLLILDEPTAGVDVEIRLSIWALLTRMNQEGTTIILTTHYLEEAEQLCKNIAIIHQGKIIETTSIKALLKKIHHQTFIFNMLKPLDVLPDIELLAMQLIDPYTLEIHLDNTVSLNELFFKLNQHGIIIQSMRNKTNRLEELFLDLIRYEK